MEAVRTTTLTNPVVDMDVITQGGTLTELKGHCSPRHRIVWRLTGSAIRLLAGRSVTPIPGDVWISGPLAWLAASSAGHADTMQLLSVRLSQTDHTRVCVFCPSEYGNRPLVAVVLGLRQVPDAAPELMVTYMFGPGTIPGSETGYELLHVAGGDIWTELVISDHTITDLISVNPPEKVDWGEAATKGGSLQRVSVAQEMFIAHVAGSRLSG